VIDSFEIYQAVILIVIGLMAGVINTLAGGGSNLSLPALMMYGLPADIANATNRVSVLMQSVTAARGFYKHDKIEATSVKDSFWPLLVGGLVGAVTASYLNVDLLKPLLLGTMIAVSLWVVFKSDTKRSENVKRRSCYDSKLTLLTTFSAGFYGGFIQAGVGFAFFNWVLITIFMAMMVVLMNIFSK
jgi:uncharacterized membrane protein YfcA